MKAAMPRRAGREGPAWSSSRSRFRSCRSDWIATSWRSYGLNADDVNEFIETAMNGARRVGSRADGQRTFDLVVRLRRPVPRQIREKLAAAVGRHCPSGGADAARRRWPTSSTTAARTRSTAKTSAGASSCSANGAGATWTASWTTFKHALADPGDAADGLLRSSTAASSKASSPPRE